MTPLLARSTSAEKQFERMYQRYVADVYRYALAVMRNAQDAEDVTQTAFMNALRAMQNGERPDAPKNWLIAITHNVCRQRFRQAQRRPQESPLFEDSAEAAVPEQEAGYSAEDIQRALGQLAFNQRSALVMRELEGRSYAEIAAIMEMSVSAVETVLFRARRALREQLEGTLTCAEAERFLSKQLDGELTRSERSGLRAHLRACEECSGLARSQRASRGSLKALFGAIPLPGSLLGAGSSATIGITAKAAAVVAAASVVGTGGYEAAKKIEAPSKLVVAAASVHSVPAPAVAAHAGIRAVVSTTPRSGVTTPNHGTSRSPVGLAHAQNTSTPATSYRHPVTTPQGRIHISSAGGNSSNAPVTPVHVQPEKPVHPVTPAAKPTTTVKAKKNPVTPKKPLHRIVVKKKTTTTVTTTVPRSHAPPH
jgi:RNA polymerase sigma factor (sigma-70 family)